MKDTLTLQFCLLNWQPAAHSVVGDGGAGCPWEKDASDVPHKTVSQNDLESTRDIVHYIGGGACC